MRRLQAEYAPRGVNLVRVAGKWMFRTANDLAWLLARDTVEPKKLSRAANETLAIIAYHQPVTRAEIEDIRGVSVSKGTLDVLMETGWIRLRGRRKAPGRPLTFGTTEAFLSHFGLEAIGDLPGLDELKGTGLLDGRLPAGFSVPLPSDDATLREDEDPLEPGDLDLGPGTAAGRRPRSSGRPRRRDAPPHPRARRHRGAADLRGRDAPLRRDRSRRGLRPRYRAGRNRLACSGHSGCGKTTLLRLAAGVERPSTGAILINDREVAGASFEPPERRGVGLMFQDFALFPHLSNLANVMFGLKSLPKADAEREARLALDRVGLGEYAELIRTCSRAASSSASRLRARLRRGRACC